MSRYAVVGALAAVVGALVVCPPAMAADGGAPSGSESGPTGGGPVTAQGLTPVETPEQAAQGRAKVALATAYGSYRSGGLSGERYDALAAAYDAAYGGHSLTVPAGRRAAKLVASFPSRVLGVVQHDQATNYYCGPSTAESIVQYVHGSGHSAYGAHESLVQAHLAGSSYLDTERHRATRWQDGRMSIALNRWISGHTNDYYINTSRPSTSQFKDFVVHDIDNSRPLAASTVEFKDSPNHYNRHPVSLTIGHWVPVRGYSVNAGSTYFADPAHSSQVSWGEDPLEYFSYSTTSFASRYLQSNGMTW